MFHGLTGTVNAVEVYGLVFIENDEAEAKAARSKALELASEVAVANSAAAVAEGAAAPTPMPEPAAALDSEPFCSVETSCAPAVHRISYAAAASKTPVGTKPSAAGGFEPRTVAAPKFSADLERSTPAAQPAAVHAPLEVSICIMSIHIYICRCSMHIHAQVHVYAHNMCMCTQHTCTCMCMCMCMYQ